MAEKADRKKKQGTQQKQQVQQQQQQQQQKKKKMKQPEKKKNQANGVKHNKKELSLYQSQYKLTTGQKKSKGNENSNTSSNINYNKSSKKKSGSDERSFFWVFCTRTSYILLILGFIYIVDFEKFAGLRDGATFYVNKTVNFLPPEVVTKGKQAVEFIQPAAEFTLNKANVFIKEASVFLNTNPIVKEHWTNIREISSICSARLVDYMRTLYLQTTTYCNDVKIKLFN